MTGGWDYHAPVKYNISQGARNDKKGCDTASLGLLKLELDSCFRRNDGRRSRNETINSKSEYRNPNPPNRAADDAANSKYEIQNKKRLKRPERPEKLKKRKKPNRLKRTDK